MKDDTRRGFLKVTGAAIAGSAALPLLSSCHQGGSGHGHGASDKQGKQWAMVVDIRKCLQDKGCTKCIQACHQTHNVPDISDPRYQLPAEEIPKRELKWIWKEHYEGAFPEQQHDFTREGLDGEEVLVLCNHCENPPCVRVCPTQATWKREEDGLVMMDMHRCIGCRYCIVGCPYGSRSFNWLEPWPRPFARHGTPPNMKYPTRTKGVVEKCNFCAERLAEHQRTGKPYVPACVEACPTGALVFGDVYDERSAVRQLLKRTHTIRRKPNLGTGPQVYYIV